MIGAESSFCDESDAEEIAVTKSSVSCTSKRPCYLSTAKGNKLFTIQLRAKLIIAVAPSFHNSAVLSRQ